MSKYWKIIIPILFALAVLLGLTQRKTDPFLGFTTKTFKHEQNIAPDKTLSQYFIEAENFGKQANTSKANFLAVGDIVLSRKVALAIKNSNNPFLPFSQMAALFDSADFTFGNLESPANGTEFFSAAETMVFNSPKTYLQGLKKYKFNILNLANNHALDQGKKGLEYTLKYLNENYIKHIGTGQTLSEAWAPAMIEQNGIKICFIGASYASINDGGKTENNFVSRIEDIADLKLRIENLKLSCDFIVASMHAGTEYTRKPNQAQIEFAYSAIDAGADMVIGSHPHWIQTIEKYCPEPHLPSPYQGEELKAGSPSLESEGTKEDSPPLQGGVRGGNCKYIFYSLGNFIFDQMWSQETREGLVLKIQITKSKLQNPLAPKAATLDDLQGGRLSAKLESIELIPVIIDNYSTPRPANEEETKKILKKIDFTEKILK
jgi:poly-gamma-glutamate capsule biosynthesis protein CapA/YwtB (metallophosphatase superfamily)